METRILNDLSVHGSFIMAKDRQDFPENPVIGTFVVKEQCLYGYIKIGGMETWYPFATRTNSYVHSQGIATLKWVIVHNLGTTDVWVQVKDQTGSVVNALVTAVDENTVHVDFTSATMGTAVVVAPDSINVPQIKASEISVANDVIVMDSGGIQINGSYVLTSANIESYADAAIEAERQARIAGDASLQSDINAEVTRATAAESTLQTVINNNINQPVKTTSSPTFAGITTTGNIVPSVDVTYDIGSPTKRFKDLYLSGSTIYVGDGKIFYDSVNDRFNFFNELDQVAAVSLSANTTDDLAEGSTNLYYTNARVQAIVDVEAAARQSADTTLQTSISNEVTRATNAEGTIQGNINTVGSNLSAEVTRATAAESSLQTAINTETSSRTTAISNLQTSLQNEIATKISSSEKGVANGVATLNAVGLIPASQLPSYVDDVLEFADFASLPASGSTGKIYVTINDNKIYRWTGSSYIEISPTVGNADTASKLATARTITLSGDISGSVSFDGSQNVTLSTTVNADSVTLGTDTTGVYVASVSTTAPLSGGSVGSEGANLTIALADGYGDTKNPFGSKTAKHVLAAPNGADGAPTFRALVASDIPVLNQNTTGSAASLTTARTFTIGSTGKNFNGTSNVSWTLAEIGAVASNTAITAGTATKVTYDAKGLVTSGTTLVASDIPNLDWSKITSGKPTTLTGYGITDAISSTGNQLPLTNGQISSVTLSTTTTTVNQVVDSVSASTYRTVKYVVQVTSGTAYQAVELLIVHNGTSAYITEYGNVSTGANLANFDADVSGGNVRLLVTPTNAVTTIKAIRQAVSI